MATVQQMFGRAGRVGAGEDRGWAFMITDDPARAGGLAGQAGGRAHGALADPWQPAGPGARRGGAAARVSQREAEQWWVHTLAYHQGQRSLRPLRRAITFLRFGPDHLREGNNRERAEETQSSCTAAVHDYGSEWDR